jgi:hypothetical protein
MAMFDKKKVALELRREGESIIRIAHEVGVSKSTVSIWCRDIELTHAQRERLTKNTIEGGHAGRVLGAEVNRRKKLEAVALGHTLAQKEVGTVNQRDLLMLAIALYWAEGSKTGSRFIFVNSDPDTVEYMCSFLERVMHIEKSRISLTVQINDIHRPRIAQVTAFWSQRLSVPLAQFTKPYYVKTVAKKVYENHDTYYGVIRLRVLKGSGLQYRMLGYISALREKHMLM